MIICDECKNSGDVSTYSLTIKDKLLNLKMYEWEIDLCENCKGNLNPNTFRIGLEAMRKHEPTK